MYMLSNWIIMISLIDFDHKNPIIMYKSWYHDTIIDNTLW